MQSYDVIVVGGGIAGATAAIYLKRAGRSVAVIERGTIGGLIVTAHKVENYPLVKSVSGYEIADMLEKQLEELKIDIIYDNINSFKLDPLQKELVGNSDTYTAKNIILAMGSSPKPLGLENESALVGSGVSYCTTCDGAFFRGRDVLVAGIGAHAVSSVNYLAPIANKVYVVAPTKIKNEHKNVEILDGHSVTALLGSPLKGVRITNENGQEKELNVEGLFVASGNVPSTLAVKDFLQLDDKGYILTDESMKTSVDGVYAVGDIRKKALRQLVTAASDGAIAAVSCLKNKG